MKHFRNGLLTGLTLQLAIGPVFFFIINLALFKTVFDGLAGALAAMTVDYLYISLAIFGVGKILEHKKIKKKFGIISASVLIILGLLILKGAFEVTTVNRIINITPDIFGSFLSVFLLTIASPMTIIFFTSLFSTKAVEGNYSQKELIRFGIGVGLSTFLFMGSAVLIFSLIKETIPVGLIQILNAIVGLILVGYGIKRLIQISRS